MFCISVIKFVFICFVFSKLLKSVGKPTLSANSSIFAFDSASIKSDIDVSGSCEAQLTSNKARIRAIITPDCEFDFTVAFG